MATKDTYNGKPVSELTKELTTLRALVREHQSKMMQSKGVKEYRNARKNIARILTALQSSTKAEK
jgi:ribosomal protein L29